MQHLVLAVCRACLQSRVSKLNMSTPLPIPTCAVPRLRFGLSGPSAEVEEAGCSSDGDDSGLIQAGSSDQEDGSQDGNAALDRQQEGQAAEPQRGRHTGNAVPGGSSRGNKDDDSGGGDLHSSDFDSEAYEAENDLMQPVQARAGSGDARPTEKTTGQSTGAVGAQRGKQGGQKRSATGKTAAEVPGRARQRVSGGPASGGAGTIQVPPVRSKDMPALPSQRGVKGAAVAAQGGKVVKKAAAKPKKNRLGQHARQRLNEEQFGQSAKHLEAKYLEVWFPLHSPIELTPH